LYLAISGLLLILVCDRAAVVIAYLVYRV